MNGVAATVGDLVPWVALLGFFGLLLKVRVSGDPALWKRIGELEKRLDEQQDAFRAELAREREARSAELKRERDDCEQRLADMEGVIRQLQQREQSFGHLRPLEGQLRTAFPVSREPDRDADILKELDQKPGRKRR